jgi:MFS family permease
VFSTSQFLGIFAGGLLGGAILTHAGPAWVFMLGLAGVVLWLGVAGTMASPSHLSNRAYGLPASWRPAAEELEFRIGKLSGVGEVRVSAHEAAVYLKVDPAHFDEGGLRALFTSWPAQSTERN